MYVSIPIWYIYFETYIHSYIYIYIYFNTYMYLYKHMCVTKAIIIICIWAYIYRYNVFIYIHIYVIKAIIIIHICVYIYRCNVPIVFQANVSFPANRVSSKAGVIEAKRFCIHVAYLHICITHMICIHVYIP